MEKKEREQLKELFAEWGLWGLVEDISDDGDGTGDNLQLTKEGLEAHRMIEELLEEREMRAYSDGYTDGITRCMNSLDKLNKKK